MTQEKRLKDAKAAAKEGDIRVFQTHNGGVMIPGVKRQRNPGYEPLAPLGRSTFRSCIAVIFTTDFHGIEHGFSQYCVNLCFVLC